MNAQTEDTARELLDEIIEERDRARSLPVLDVRWYVVEIHPAYYNDLLVHIPGTIERVSPYFATKEDAEVWASGHAVSHGGDLMIKVQYLKEFTVKRWSSF